MSIKESKLIMIDEIKLIPKIIFIVPYRNRKPHLNCFLHYMPYILNQQYKEHEYEIIISHQNDSRPFNRGAMKNLGFLYAKNKYPSHYLLWSNGKLILFRRISIRSF